MNIKLSKAAAKFLKKLDSSNQKAVIAKIGTLKTCLETQKIYSPYHGQGGCILSHRDEIPIKLSIAPF